MSGQRAAARVARRELRRRPVTTVLVALLVALPVAAMVVAVVALRTYPEPVEVIDQQSVGNGQASLSTWMPDAAEATARIRDVSPDARIVPIRVASGSLTAPDDEQVQTTVSSGDFSDPLIRDRYRVDDGRMPTGPGELAVSTAFAERWGLAVGDEFVADELDLAGRVVGIADMVGGRWKVQLFAASFPALDPATVTEQLFIDDPYGFDDATLAVLGDLGASGVLHLRSDLAASTPVPSLATRMAVPAAAGSTELAVAAAWGGGAMALAVLGVVISSAFAIGARRQLHTLGLLAANGAPPPVVRGAVVWQGLWTGALGTAIGVGLGAVTLAGLWPFRRSFLDYDPSSWVWSPRDLLPAVALGLLAPTLAASLPARTAGHLTVLQSLAGRRPLPPVRRRVVAAGLVSAAAGLVLLAGATVGNEWKPWRQGIWTTGGVIGGFAVLAGAITAAPVAIGAAGRLGGRANGSLKLALRNLGRQRSRSSAVVAGIIAAAALCLGVGAATASTQRQTEDRQLHLADHIASLSAWAQTNAGAAPATLVGPDGFGQASAQPFQPTFAPTPTALLDEVQTAVPDAVRIDIPLARAGVVGFDVDDAELSTYLNTRSPRAAPATPELLDALEVPADARSALDRGEVVALGAPASVKRMTLSGYLANRYPAGDEDGIAVTPFPDAEGWFNLPSVLLPPAVADEVGLSAAPGWDAVHLFVSPDRLTDDEWSAIREVNSYRGGAIGRFRLAGDPEPAPQQEWPTVELVAWAAPQRFDASGPLLWTSAATLAFTALVVALGLALAARDTRDERDVLEAVGAPPKLLRRLAGSRAAVLALIGAVVAMPTGLLPVWVVERASRPAMPVAVPWTTIVAVVVVIPAAIGAGALLGAAVTSWRRPTIGSRFAAD